MHIDKKKEYYNIKRSQKKKRKKRQRQRNFRLFLFILLICLIIIIYFKQELIEEIKSSNSTTSEVKKGKKENPPKKKKKEKKENKPEKEKDPVQIAMEVAKRDDLPESVIKMLKKNPETAEYVINYEEKKNSPYFADSIPLPEDGSYPLFLQFDQRWGYMSYAGGKMADSGCGPTACAMLVSKMLNDPKYTPAFMAKYASENGFMSPNNGTYGSFMTGGMRSLGLNVFEGKLNVVQTMNALNNNQPIICLMNPGTFTDTGHYILLVGTNEGKIIIRDPFSKARTNKLWTFDELEPEIKLMWRYTK